MLEGQSQKRTMASQLADSVRNDIVNGTLPPGTRLNLNALSKQYAAGVNPLREALSRLSATGFITAEDQRGFKVSEISRKELIDTQRVRTELECIALRLSIANGDINWESELIAAHHRMSRIQRTPMGERLSLDVNWETGHHDFHMALLSACESEWLMLFINTLFECSTRYRKAMLLFKNTLGRDVETEHKNLMDAALNKDADHACALLTAHFNETTELILSSMDKAKK
ncbi:MAG: FCD domain-containing protein [Emcibacter sp.]|nr:FCD domain-containing protein [Emcibacter sp.]